MVLTTHKSSPWTKRFPKFATLLAGNTCQSAASTNILGNLTETFVLDTPTIAARGANNQRSNIVPKFLAEICNVVVETGGLANLFSSLVVEVVEVGVDTNRP
jgi:hypothetical protein